MADKDILNRVKKLASEAGGDPEVNTVETQVRTHQYAAFRKLDNAANEEVTENRVDTETEQ